MRETGHLGLWGWRNEQPSGAERARKCTLPQNFHEEVCPIQSSTPADKNHLALLVYRTIKRQMTLFKAITVEEMCYRSNGKEISPHNNPVRCVIL
jgi:hypothetical protein